MNKNVLKPAMSIALAAIFSACSVLQTNEGNHSFSNSPNDGVADLSNSNCGPGTQIRVSKHMINKNGKPAEAIKIRVTGYGAEPKSFYPEPQRRLMAMRAAKIDAYRSLAERITGIQIWGGTTIGDMVVEKDQFRVYLDTHLTGARVISENAQEDGTFETVVELRVGQGFLSNTLPTKVSNNCNQQQNGNNPFRLTQTPSSENESSQAKSNDDGLMLSNFPI